MEVLTTRIPEDLLKDIQQIEKERSERAEVVRKLLDTAVQEWKMTKALKMISEGRWTVRRAARFAGTTYHEILVMMTDRGVDSGPALRDLRDALDHS
ncbi:hypothetical protein E6H30_02910 [Candidatus Bathyarchaeota archaeon]|nr:MAG: hypothetical protein E6H30_02910 [Candidatus Bathyarchaeota archaeon]